MLQNASDLFCQSYVMLVIFSHAIDSQISTKFIHQTVRSLTYTITKS